MFIMYYSFKDLPIGITLESLAQLSKIDEGVIVVDNLIVVEKCSKKSEITKQGVVYDFTSKESDDIYLIWKDLVMADQTYNIPPEYVDADEFDYEMDDDYPKYEDDDTDWSDLDEVLSKK